MAALCGNGLNNTLPNAKILDWFKIQSILQVYDELNVAQFIQFVLETVEILWEKENILANSVFKSHFCWSC